MLAPKARAAAANRNTPSLHIIVFPPIPTQSNYVEVCCYGLTRQCFFDLLNLDASGIVARSHFAERRYGLPTLVAGKRAARIEDAPGRRRQMARQLAFDQPRCTPLLDRRVGDGRGVEQDFRIRMQ